MEGNGENQIFPVSSPKQDEVHRTSHRIQPEVRDFEINPEKSLQKLQSRADSSDIVLEKTGGGLILKLNAGVYQLIKSAAHHFYTRETQQHTCTIIPVKDKKGYQVETKYKISNGKINMYTFNLYHTRCSCLINGKNEEYFIETDFPKIIDLVEEKLTINNLTMTDFKNCVKEALQNKNTVNTSSENSRTVTETPPRNNSNEGTIFLTDSPFVLPEDALSESYICSTPNFIDDQMTCMLNDVRKGITDICSLLQEHITESGRQMGILKDELISIKSHVTVHCNSVSQQIETVETSTKQLETLLSTSTQTIQKRLQAISDNVKSTTQPSHDRNQLPANEHTKIRKDKCNMASSSVSTDKTAPAPEVRRAPIETPPFIGRPVSSTLITGDSLLKGIRTRGLQHGVQVSTLPGKTSRGICTPLRHLDMSECDNVVIYAGGNDVASGNSITSIEQELRETVQHLNNGRRRVFLCSICPRIDINVNPLNSMIRRLCDETQARLIDVNLSFVRNDGRPLFHLFHSDGIHLNDAGSNMLVKVMDREVSIIRGGSAQQNRRPFFVQRNRTSHAPLIRENTDFNRNATATRDTRRYPGPPQRHHISTEFNAGDGRSTRFLSHGTGSSPRSTYYDRRTHFSNRRERRAYDDDLTRDRRQAWNTSHPQSGSVYYQ